MRIWVIVSLIQFYFQYAKPISEKAELSRYMNQVDGDKVMVIYKFCSDAFDDDRRSWNKIFF